MKKSRKSAEKSREGGEKPREGGEKSREGGEKSREGVEKSRKSGEKSREGVEKSRKLFFIDFLSKWWFVHGFFVEVVVFSWMFRRYRVFFVENSWKWCVFH